MTKYMLLVGLFAVIGLIDRISGQDADIQNALNELEDISYGPLVLAIIESSPFGKIVEEALEDRIPYLQDSVYDEVKVAVAESYALLKTNIIDYLATNAIDIETCISDSIGTQENLTAAVSFDLTNTLSSGLLSDSSFDDLVTDLTATIDEAILTSTFDDAVAFFENYRADTLTESIAPSFLRDVCIILEDAEGQTNLKLRETIQNDIAVINTLTS